MSFYIRIIVNLIISIIFAQLIALFTYEYVSKINSKNIYLGVFQINLFDKNSAYLDKTVTPKINIYTYEAKDEIINNVEKGSNCANMFNYKSSIDLGEDKLTQYFTLNLTSTAPKKIMEGCFDEFIASVDKKYYKMVNDIEKNFNNETKSNDQLNKIYQENSQDLNNYNNSEFSYDLEQMVLLEKYKAFVSEDIKRIDFQNLVENLRSTKPLNIVRIKFFETKFGKNSLIFSLTLIIFFFIFIIFNSSQIFNIEKLNKFKKSIGLN